MSKSIKWALLLIPPLVIAVLIGRPLLPSLAAQPSQPFRLEEATIEDLHRAIRAGEITCVEIVRRYIARARAYNGVPSLLVTEEKTIKGSYMGSCVPVRDIPRFIGLYQQGRLPVDRMVSRRVGLDELNEGFDRLQAVATVRQLLVPHG